MKLTEHDSSDKEQRYDDEQYETQKRPKLQGERPPNAIARKLIEAIKTVEIECIEESQQVHEREGAPPLVEASPRAGAAIPRVAIPSFLSYANYYQSLNVPKGQNVAVQPVLPAQSLPPQSVSQPSSRRSWKYTLLFMGLLGILVFQTLSSGPSQFIGAQGWAYVLGGPASTGNRDILNGVGKPAQQAGTKAQQPHKLTPEQYVNLVMQRMTLDQKLGQMMIVQFVGPSYSLDLSTMVKSYNVGSVLIFAANQNIVSKSQLKGLIAQMQGDSTIPLAVAIDQEGGYVDRLATLDGPRPSETAIGATGDPNVARKAGLQDAQDLSYYGINLNLAPVVDVTDVYNSQLDHRTYGDTAALVTKMAGAYLSGLQQSGKVLGTLKHFPGLGDVAVDPHVGVPQLTRSQNDLEHIDWAPYRSLISQGNTVHAIMVTHELVEALDSITPSSLSYKVVTGILRNEFGFKGVIMTDSLTMEGIAAYYNEAQAAALSVEAGSDLLMGASTPSDLASMIQGIKGAINDGKISQQRIDDSVRRILLMKYAMGLLSIPNN